MSIGDIVKFEGKTYRIVTTGDVPGTFDLFPTNDRPTGDIWRNVPPTAIEPTT